MEALFTSRYIYLWMAALALALFLPVRRLVWVLYVRRAQRHGETEDAERERLKRRAGFTAALLCFAFSFFYVSHLFQGRP